MADKDNLLEPENSKQLEMCKIAQKYLSDDWCLWPLPSEVELKNDYALVWFVYENE